MEYLSRVGGVHHLSGIFIQRGGGYTTSVEHFSTWGGVHQFSGIFIVRGGGTPPQWNIYPEGGGTPPQWNIYPEGGGYTTSVEHLS